MYETRLTLITTVILFFAKDKYMLYLHLSNISQVPEENIQSVIGALRTNESAGH